MHATLHPSNWVVFCAVDYVAKSINLRLSVTIAISFIYKLNNPVTFVNVLVVDCLFRALKDAEKAITLAKDWPKGYFRKGRALSGLRVSILLAIL